MNFSGQRDNRVLVASLDPEKVPHTRNGSYFTASLSINDDKTWQSDEYGAHDLAEKTCVTRRIQSSGTWEIRGNNYVFNILEYNNSATKNGQPVQLSTQNNNNEDGTSSSDNNPCGKTVERSIEAVTKSTHYLPSIFLEIEMSREW